VTNRGTVRQPTSLISSHIRTVLRRSRRYVGCGPSHAQKRPFAGEYVFEMTTVKGFALSPGFSNGKWELKIKRTIEA